MSGTNGGALPAQGRAELGMGRGSGGRRAEILCIGISKATSNTQTTGLLFFFVAFNGKISLKVS